MSQELKIALLLGGPSAERGISLNSARSVADHLEGDGVTIDPIVYFDTAERPYSISRKMLYSNTPSDFDFKLSQVAHPLTEEDLARLLTGADIAFPVMHGEFGEDGTVQTLLERLGVPYVGSEPSACAASYDKYSAHEALRAAGIATVPSMLYRRAAPDGSGSSEDRDAVDRADRVVVKPARGGSSLGVSVVGRGEDDVEAHIRHAVDQHDRVVAQPYVDGIELTTVVLDGPDGPVALIPVEVELRRRESNGILSFRHKYLPSDDSRYHCPPRLPIETTAAIQEVAQSAFLALGLRDFARIDCWLGADGQVRVSDVNPISGMEQNSFLFIQAAESGMTHADVLRFILATACRRQGRTVPEDRWRAADDRPGRIPIPVLFGGRTAERHVSVISGTNVWLKLRRSDRFAPVPYLLEDVGHVWELSYPVALRHSAEHIAEACRSAVANGDARRALAGVVVERLRLEPWQLRVGDSPPRLMSMSEFLEEPSFVFIALHGGFGEGGALQSRLDERGIAYNGSGPATSALCIDKHETGVRIEKAGLDGVESAPKVKRPTVSVMASDPESLWPELQHLCATPTVMVKPLDDGCSMGIVPLTTAGELKAYVDALSKGQARVQPGTFSALAGDQVVEMPDNPSSLVFEGFVTTDDITVIDSDQVDGEPARLAWSEERDTGLIEITVGVVGPAGDMHAFQPSLTIARKGVLSVEEKFMGGTGVNITPPPVPPLGRVSPAAVSRARRSISQVANVLGIHGYARIDAFMHRDTGEVTIIEANTLPGLTPSTVIYHQGLEENPPLYPRSLLELIIDLGIAARDQRAGRASEAAASGSR